LAAQTAASVNDDSSMVSASAGESQLETTNGTGNDTAEVASNEEEKKEE